MDPARVLSGFEHYWKHWNAVEEWRQRHQDAYASVQKTFADIDNRCFIQQELDASYINVINRNDYDSDVKDRFENDDCIKTCNKVEQKSYDDQYISCNDDNDDDDDDNSELEFVVNEEMIAFFEQSMKHKLELKRERESMKDKNFNISDILDEVNCEGKGKKKKGNTKASKAAMIVPVPSIGVDDQKRTREMALLYGDASPKICGMETAVQLSFNRLCDRYKPIHWPCIPFKP